MADKDAGRYHNVVAVPRDAGYPPTSLAESELVSMGSGVLDGLRLKIDR